MSLPGGDFVVCADVPVEALATALAVALGLPERTYALCWGGRVVDAALNLAEAGVLDGQGLTLVDRTGLPDRMLPDDTTAAPPRAAHPAQTRRQRRFGVADRG